eukprot:787527-Pleurochrysis_carterae.AAC.4
MWVLLLSDHNSCRVHFPYVMEWYDQSLLYWDIPAEAEAEPCRKDFCEAAWPSLCVGRAARRHKT